MCPNIGMSPDKNAESPGARGARPGPTGTLPEARGASSPCSSGVDQARGAEDEELTNLNWLHENLLQNFTLGGPEASPGSGPLFDIEEGARCDSPSSSCVFPSSSSCCRDTEKDPLKSKPPFSFSLLIYMAIEQSPTKSLPVKDIYGWILDHFPYFSSAPTGWKNSVRHNLSLNKCFRKVEKNLGKVNGKGSLWCVDPEYQPSLVQALKKQRFPASYAFCTPPASPPRASSPPRHLLLRDQSCSLKESDIDAATAMMLLNATPELHVNQYDQDSPMDLSRRDLVLVSRDPKQDHNYSSVSLQRRSSHLRARRAGSEGFHSDEDSDPGEDRGPPGKRERREACPDLDDELKAAAGSLLHLAGLRSCLETSQRSAKSLKLSRKHPNPRHVFVEYPFTHTAITGLSSATSSLEGGVAKKLHNPGSSETFRFSPPVPSCFFC